MVQLTQCIKYILFPRHLYLFTGKVSRWNQSVWLLKLIIEVIEATSDISLIIEVTVINWKQITYIHSSKGLGTPVQFLINAFI